MTTFEPAMLVNELWRRRSIATAIDYALIVCYVVALVVIGGLLWALGLRPTVDSLTARVVAQLLAFLVLGLPVTLWFAREDVVRGGSYGKRVAHLRVKSLAADGRCSGGQALLRVALKILLPWELAHTALWDMLAWPGDGGTNMDIALLTASYSLVFVYLGTALLGSGRTPHDRIAGTEVVSDHERNQRID